MKLNLSFRPKISQIVAAIALIVAAFFIIHVAFWEKAYYGDMEGSTRDVAAVSDLSSTTALEETMPTAEEIIEYEVPTGYPRYLTIESLSIKNARILGVGLTEDGTMATPINIYDAAWYNASAFPGQGGTVLINGHNGANLRGIFKELNRLKVGAIVEIEVGGGDRYLYEVVENTAIPLAQADAYMPTAMQSPVPGQESLTLISCSGQWLNDKNTYDHRQFVRAVRK